MGVGRGEVRPPALADLEARAHAVPGGGGGDRLELSPQLLPRGRRGGVLLLAGGILEYLPTLFLLDVICLRRSRGDSRLRLLLLRRRCFECELPPPRGLGHAVGQRPALVRQCELIALPGDVHEPPSQALGLVLHHQPNGVGLPAALPRGPAERRVDVVDETALYPVQLVAQPFALLDVPVHQILERLRPRLQQPVPDGLRTDPPARQAGQHTQQPEPYPRVLVPELVVPPPAVPVEARELSRPPVGPVPRRREGARVLALGRVRAGLVVAVVRVAPLAGLEEDEAVPEADEDREPVPQGRLPAEPRPLVVVPASSRRRELRRVARGRLPERPNGGPERRPLGIEGA